MSVDHTGPHGNRIEFMTYPNESKEHGHVS